MENILQPWVSLSFLQKLHENPGLQNVFHGLSMQDIAGEAEMNS